ncbi:MAG TPA: hypothetical protein VE981_11605 [Planctomycetota bacterium]|nr:hypothetical protein [Planctomycetota bacterium]
MIWLIFTAALQDAREVPASDHPIEVRVPVSTDALHRATVVTFPEDSLEALVAGWNEADLSIERRKENLFIKLLRKTEGDLHVLGVSGSLYRLRVVPADDGYDGRVRILAPRETKKDAPEAVDLIRAMRLGRRPVQGAVLRSEQGLYASAEWTARMLYVYETASYRGFVARVENVSGTPQRLDPSRFVAEDLVLSGSQAFSLGPGETTLLYLVFWKHP